MSLEVLITSWKIHQLHMTSVYLTHGVIRNLLPSINIFNMMLLSSRNNVACKVFKGHGYSSINNKFQNKTETLGFEPGAGI